MGSGAGPGPPSSYLQGIGRGTSGATGVVWPKGCGRSGAQGGILASVPMNVAGVPPREAAAGGYPYPRWHLWWFQHHKARLAMVLLRSRGAIPRRKWSAVLFGWPCKAKVSLPPLMTLGTAVAVSTLVW